MIYNEKKITLAIDVYGADGGESIVIDGCDIIANKINVFFIFIGKKTIIGAFSLVNKSIPANQKAYGVPCKIQDELNDN